jgi:hypothetical protein
MKTHPDFEWTFCGERYRIAFFPLTARFQVLVDREWLTQVERHRETPHARFVTVGLPNVYREQMLSALELQRTEERAGFVAPPGLAKTMPRRGRSQEAA